MCIYIYINDYKIHMYIYDYVIPMCICMIIKFICIHIYMIKKNHMCIYMII